MVTPIVPPPSDGLDKPLIKTPPRSTQAKLPLAKKQDRVEFGTSNKVSNDQAMNMVLERAMEKLRAVVGDARAELGIPEGAVLDTSPEATAQRIADFALGFFGKYAENNGLQDDEEGRKQFADFIGGAIDQGISEARDILFALNALNDDVTGQIDQTSELVHQRLDDFVANGFAG